MKFLLILSSILIFTNSFGQPQRFPENDNKLDQNGIKNSATISEFGAYFTLKKVIDDTVNDKRYVHIQIEIVYPNIRTDEIIDISQYSFFVKDDLGYDYPFTIRDFNLYNIWDSNYERKPYKGGYIEPGDRSGGWLTFDLPLDKPIMSFKIQYKSYNVISRKINFFN